MRNKSKKLFGAVLVFSLILLSIGFSSLAYAQEYAADMVSTIDNKTTQSKIYVSSDKIRMDMPEGAMIIRIDKGVSWMLMPSEKMYMENRIDMSRVPKTSKDLGAEIERTSLGMETVNGQPAEKFKVTYRDNGKTESAYQWLVNSTIHVKIEAVDGSWSMEYRNLSLGAQPADLFEIPAGYEKMTIPSFGLGM